VALKTTGSRALSAQAGIPVAAHRAVLPMFDACWWIIGDEQSIAADLSTFFGAHAEPESDAGGSNAEVAGAGDEMGTGTAPEGGAALAVALLEEFRRRIASCWRPRTMTG